jgi:hypothetical protein
MWVSCCAAPFVWNVDAAPDVGPVMVCDALVGCSRAQLGNTLTVLKKHTAALQAERIRTLGVDPRPECCLSVRSPPLGVAARSSAPMVSAAAAAAPCPAPAPHAVAAAPSVTAAATAATAAAAAAVVGASPTSAPVPLAVPTPAGDEMPRGRGGLPSLHSPGGCGGDDLCDVRSGASAASAPVAAASSSSGGGAGGAGGSADGGMVRSLPTMSIPGSDEPVPLRTRRSPFRYVVCSRGSRVRPVALTQ